VSKEEGEDHTTDNCICLCPRCYTELRQNNTITIPTRDLPHYSVMRWLSFCYLTILGLVNITLCPSSTTIWASEWLFRQGRHSRESLHLSRQRQIVRDLWSWRLLLFIALVLVT
jgi:hypothetical protein